MTLFLALLAGALLFGGLPALPGNKPCRASAGAAAGVLMTAAAFVGLCEGECTEAYLDRIASPPVWTVCYGETRGVKQGDRYTPEECRDQLMATLAEFRDGLIRCIPALPEQPESVQVALVSWSYNVGTGAAYGSTLARLQCRRLARGLQPTAEPAGLVATVLLPLATACIYRWTGVQIEQKHQKALHEAAMTWAHSATRRGIKPATRQAQDDLLAYLKQSVPDAVRALQPGAEALLRIGERYLRQAG